MTPNTIFSCIAAWLFAGPVLAGAPPNFVLILGEGHGWSSTSVQMDDAVPGSRNTRVRTPNLEKLADAGMRFANFYAPSPRCTPSRAALLTGKSPAQLHMTFVNEGRGVVDDHLNRRLIAPTTTMELPSSESTIADLLKPAGYATAHFGKWHLGRANPREHGFDENDGANNNGGPDEVDNPHPKQLYAMTERGLDFMTRQVQSGKPFYLQLSHYASRQGGDASPAALAAVKSWGGSLTERDLTLAAADFDLDLTLGLLLRKLDQLGISTNTYVIFTTDHGSPGRNSPLAGGKGMVSEGGLRVPFIIRGPGIAAGSCSHARLTGEDLLPTVAALAHATQPLPKGIEGGSFAALLTQPANGSESRLRSEFVVHFPHYDNDPIGPASAIYFANFKLIHAYETGSLKLFDIVDDPGEQHDLAREMPGQAMELNQRLSAYLATVNAQMPKPNPNYDPSKPSGSTRDRSGRGGRRNR